jgi:hypothetical protein
VVTNVAIAMIATFKAGSRTLVAVATHAALHPVSAPVKPFRLDTPALAPGFAASYLPVVEL